MATPKGEKIPNNLLKGSGLKKGQTPDGHDVIIPNSVSDKFKEVLAKTALSGMDGQGATTSQFMNLFNYYLQNVLESKSAARMDRYEQMDFIIENDPALSMTRKVLIDEILQVDTYNQPISVTSPNIKFKKAVEQLFSDLGVKSFLREIASNLITYGDAFIITDINGRQGVTKLIPVDPRDVRHRFEFSLAELQQNKNKIKRKFTAFQAIIDMANTIDSQASHFNKVLLGFQVLNTMFPFWQVLHCRQFTTRNVLAPFGKPTFYESQSEARMYLNAKVVVSMIRSSAFMREHIKIKTSEDEDPSSQWEKAQEVKQFMEMFISSNSRSSKDYPSFGEKLYYPEGLLEIEKIEAGYNFRDRFEDLEIMRQDVFTSTGLPKEYFVGGEQRQYVSDKSLIAQDKKAARQVFALQNQIIDQLIKLVEVHFSYTKEFDPYAEEFGISLPYPVPDTDDSVINLSQSKMNYAMDVVDKLKQSLDITRIPTQIVKGLLTQYFPLKDEEINKIIKQMAVDSSEEDEIGFNRIGMKAGDPFLQNRDLMDKQIDAADDQADLSDQQKDMQSQQIQMQQQQIDNPEAQQIAAGYFKKGGSLTESAEKKAHVKAYRQALGEGYLAEYRRAIQKKSLDEAFNEVYSKSLVENNEEFVFGGRHYLTNKYVSPDRNSTGIVSTAKDTKGVKSLNEIKIDEKDRIVEDSEEDYNRNHVYNRTGLKEGKFSEVDYLDNTHVLEDTSLDKRFVDKKNKAKPKKNII